MNEECHGITWSMYAEHKLAEKKIIVSTANIAVMGFNKWEKRMLSLCYRNLEFKLSLEREKEALREYKRSRSSSSRG